MKSSIRKRGTRWTVVVPIGRHPRTGRVMHVSTSFRARDEADRHLRDIETLAALAGMYAAHDPLTARQHAILEAIEQAPAPLTVRQLARDFSLAVSTVHHHLLALCRRGALMWDGRHYAPWKQATR